jgi:hypothetical protein
VKDIVWIASYPKSGNTWVRFFLYNYLVGPVTSTRDIGRRLPDFHNEGEIGRAAPVDGKLFVKTHLAWPPPAPLLERTAGCIYVLRHPKDTMLSNLHYCRLTAETAAGIEKVDDRAYISEYIRTGGDPYWRLAGFGSWAEHAESWHAAPVPSVVIRYEDLKANPAAGFGKVLEFLKATPDPDRLAAAVAASKFEQMRAVEIRAKRGASADAVFNGAARNISRGLFFMNKGQVGQTLAHIEPGLDDRFDAAFAEAMKRFGYRPS